MTTKEFAEKCKETMLYPTYKEKVACLSLGLIEEVFEVEEILNSDPTIDEVKGEIGDVLYYAISLSHFYGYTPVVVVATSNYREAVPILAKCINKIIRDDDYAFITQKRILEFKSSMDLFYTYALSVCAAYDLTLSQVYKYNVAKLQKRKREGKLSGDGSNR